MTSLVNVAIQFLEKSREIRYVPSMVLNTDPISQTVDGQNVFRELNPDKTSMAFTFLHFPIRQQPSEIVNSKKAIPFYGINHGFCHSKFETLKPLLSLTFNSFVASKNFKMS